MLRVRVPPELLATTNHVLVEQRSARLPVTQEIVGSNPIGDARTRWRGTQTGKAATDPRYACVPDLRDRLWVRLPPVLLNGSCSSRLPVKQLSENKRGGRREVQFLHDPLPTWPVLLTAGCEPLKLAIRVQVPYGSLTQPSGGTGIRATLRTSCPLGHASSTLALATDIAGAAGAQSGFISPTSPARYRDLQLDMLRVGQCSFGPHKPELPGATPGPAT